MSYHAPYGKLVSWFLLIRKNGSVLSPFAAASDSAKSYSTMGSSSRGSSHLPGGGSSTSERQTRVLEIPFEYIGNVVGPQGAVLWAIKHDTGVFLTMEKGTMRGAPRPLVMRGTPESLDKATQLVNAVLEVSLVLFPVVYGKSCWCFRVVTTSMRPLVVVKKSSVGVDFAAAAAHKICQRCIFPKLPVGARPFLLYEVNFYSVLSCISWLSVQPDYH